jgi:hypothetical protein
MLSIQMPQLHILLHILPIVMMMRNFTKTNYKRGVLKNLSSANVKRRLQPMLRDRDYGMGVGVKRVGVKGC